MRRKVWFLGLVAEFGPIASFGFHSSPDKSGRLRFFSFVGFNG
jgi:hypothetical protein